MCLMVAMVFTMLPVQAFATNGQPQTAVDTGDVTVQGTNGFGTLLSQDIQEYQEESTLADAEYEGGYSILDLTFNGAVATVEYSSLEEAILVVALYFEDGLQMVASGKTEVSPDEDIAVVTIEGDIPKYFQASAYLVDTNDFSPLCVSYDTPMYTREMQELLASTVDDYDADRVLNLDNDKTTNFAVFADETIVIENIPGINEVISIDEENLTYVIVDADNQIKGLKSGDVFVFTYAEDDVIIAKVREIDIEGDKVTIVGGELEMEEVFNAVKVEGTDNTDNMVVDENTVEDGVTYEGLVDASDPHAVNPLADEFVGEISRSAKFSLDKDFIDKGGIKVKLTGEVSFSAKIELSYYVSTTKQFTNVKIEKEIKGSIGVTGKLEKELRLCKAPFRPFPGLTIAIEPTLKIEVTGSVEFSAAVSSTVGFTFERGKKPKWHNGKPKFDADVKAEVAIFMGLDLKPQIDIGEGWIAKFELEMPIGIEFKIRNTGHGNAIRGELDESWHECVKCLDIEPSVKMELTAKIQFLKMKKLKYSGDIFSLSISVGHLYFSFDRAELGFSICPYQTYRVTFQLKDGVNLPMRQNEVFLTKASGKKTSIGLTNDKGAIFTYLPEGKYTVSATILGEEVKRKITVNDSMLVTLQQGKNYSESSKDYISADECIDDTIIVLTGRCGDDLFWNLDSRGRLMISGTGPMWNYDYDETPWYSKRSSIKEVWLGCRFDDEVTSIGDYAFNDCDNLTYVDIPDGVSTIGSSAFRNCDNLKRVTISDSVANIGRSAFGDCTNLTSVTIPDSVTAIGDFAFSYCSSLNSVKIGNNVSVIGTHAFYDCTSLTSVEIPDSVNSIGAGAFNNCSSLTTVTIGNSVTSIGDLAFSWCDSLTEIVFRGNAPTFESDAGIFVNVTATAYYPAGNATWTSAVMKNHGGSITWVPYTLNRNGDMVVDEAAAVTVEYEEIDILYAPSEEPVMQSGLELPELDFGDRDDTLDPNAVYDGDYSSVVTESYTLKIASFSGLVPGEQYVLLAMVSVDVEDPLAADNLLCIDQAAALEDGTLVFEYIQRVATETSYVVACGASSKNLKDAQITFPEMVTDGEIQTVDPTVVYDGKTLTEGVDYTIQGTVSFIEAGTYTCYIRGVRNYTGLVECTYTVDIPRNVVVFGDCGTNVNWALYDDGTLIISGTGSMTEYSASRPAPWNSKRSSIVTIIIGDDVTSIGYCAFQNCDNLTTVMMGNSVTTIQYGAFKQCVSLTSITIPDSVTSIGDDAFYRCYSLTSVMIPDNVTSIGDYAFSGCTSLTSVTISDGVTSIGSGAFSSCTSLMGIYVDGNNIAYSSDERGVLFDKERVNLLQAPSMISGSYMIPDSVTSIGDSAFSYCDSLTSVMIPDSVTSIGAYAFYDCTSLTCAEIPNSVTSVGNYAFYHCTSLTRVEILDGVTSIGAYAFRQCTNLAYVTIGNSVTSIGHSAFRNCTTLNQITFTGDAPAIGNYAFFDVFATVYYPENNLTWTADVMQDYGGTITWVPYGKCGHKYEVVVTDPSCTEGGYITYTCSVCGDSYVTDETEALGHTEVIDKAIAATCTASGLTEGKHCSACKVVLVAQQTIPALGHTEVIDKAVAATCTVTGLTEGEHCSTCNEVLVAQQTVPALGHTEVIDKAVIATCTTTGLTEGKHCSACNEILVKQNVVPATGHTWEKWGGNEWVVARVPGCTTDGEEQRCCSKCFYTEERTIPATGHTEVIDNAVSATCTSTGLTQGKHCSACNVVLVAQETIPALGHTEVVDHAVAATCTTTGLTEGKHCSVCKVVLVAQETIPALGHTEVVDHAVAATCTTTGLTEGKHCSVCKVVLVAQETIPALGHTEVVDHAVAATCTTTGLTEGKHCSVCKVVLAEQEIIDTLGHSYSNGVCSNCGDEIEWIEAPVAKGSNKASTGKPMVTWEHVEGAVKYEVYRSNKKNGTYTRGTTTTGTTYTNTKAVAGKYYYYFVRAIDADGNYADSNIVGRTCDLAQTTVTLSNVASTGKIKISWEAVEGATKYEVYRATSKDGTYSRISTTSTTSVTNTKAEEGKTYYYKVRAICDVDAAAAAYSSIKSRTCGLPQPSVSIALSSKKPKVGWDKVEGAVSYKVYRATSKTGTYSLVKTTTASYYKDTKATSGKTYYYKVVAVCSNTAGNSAYSSIVSIKSK